MKSDIATSLFKETPSIQNKASAQFVEAEKTSLPTIPEGVKAEEDKVIEYYKDLRSFFRNGQAENIKSIDTTTLYPASIYSLYYQKHKVSDFPFWISDQFNFDKIGKNDINYESLRKLIDTAAKSIKNRGSQAFKTLEANLLRLELIIVEKLKFYSGAYTFAPIIDDASSDLIVKLKLPEEEEGFFKELLEEFKSNLPKKGFLLPYSPLSALYQLETSLQSIKKAKSRDIKQKIELLIARLNDVVTVEKNKGPQAKDPESVKAHLNIAESYIDFEKMASFIPEEGAKVMDNKRLQRITGNISEMMAADESLFNNKGRIILSSQLTESTKTDLQEIFKTYTISTASPANVCSHAIKIFEQEFNVLIPIFNSIRQATLELNGKYRPTLHDEYFNFFNWQNLDEQEFAACPTILVFISERELIHAELENFSEILALQIPIKFIALREMVEDRRSKKDSAIAFRQELGALAIAHRNCFFMQGSAISPYFLCKNLLNGISYFSPGIFYLNHLSYQHTDHIHDAILTAASIESRDFPNFSYYGHLDEAWGSRFHIQNNPEITSDWPIHEISFIDENGEEHCQLISFTFADYAVHFPHYANWFTLVDKKYWTDDLIPVSEYLLLDTTDAYFKLPFIWMVDTSNKLQKVVLSWQVIFHCKERMDYWHYLQENSGIHNYHVKKALENLQSEFEDKYNKEIEDIKTRHAQDLNIARQESAGHAMENLASVLLGMSLDNEVLNDIVSSEKPISEELKHDIDELEGREPLQQMGEKEEEAVQDEEIDELGEVWIETALCTTCNECTDINKQIFRYNENKQAYVVDPKGGPFADIVEAAEKCPVGIIHPGAPQDKNEKDLEELIERAKAFN